MPPVSSVTRWITFAAFGDLDASPTKAWVVTHRDEQPEFFEYAVGRLPAEELYDIKSDPHCMSNLANQSSSSEVKAALRDRLMNELKSTGDPRVSDHVVFEESPFTDPNPRRAPRKKPQNNKSRRNR